MTGLLVESLEPALPTDRAHGDGGWKLTRNKCRLSKPELFVPREGMQKSTWPEAATGCNAEACIGLVTTDFKSAQVMHVFAELTVLAKTLVLSRHIVELRVDQYVGL